MFNQFIKIPVEIRQKLKWLGEPYYYLHKNSASEMLRGILFEVSKEDMYKAWNRLSGTEGEIVNGDKVYVVPNCRIPLFKLKDFISKQGAVLTGEISEATKMIGHSKCLERVRSQARSSSMLLEMDSACLQSHYKDLYWESSDEKVKRKLVFDELMLNYRDVFDDTDLSPEDTLISMAAWVYRDNFSTVTRRFITPTGAWVLYNHILNKIPIVNEEAVYEKIGKPTVLDKESYENIRDMLASSDEENQRTAAEILANCDHDKSLFWIWRLARKYLYAVSQFSRFKNVRLFLEMSKWNSLSTLSAEEFIEHMYSREVLTKEYFDELIREAAGSYDRILSSEVFRMTLVPSEKYADYEQGQKFEFNKEVESGEVEIVEEQEDENV